MFIRVLPCFVNVTNRFFKFMDPYLWSSLYNETMGEKSRISHKLGMVNMKSPDIIKVMVAKKLPVNMERLYYFHGCWQPDSLGVCQLSIAARLINRNLFILGFRQ